MMDKIGGALDYLSSLNETHDADLIMIVDGFDVWYQLPPQIMIDRYHEVNLKAEARSQDMNDDLIEERFPQTIIIAAQKRCWPGSPNDINYYAIPESSLPKYIYGPQTDVPSNDPRNEYKRTRQRFLNAGFIIGPVKEMRTLFLRAQEKAEADREVEGKDQNVLANIFGEQEFMRSQSRLQRYYPHNSTYTSSTNSDDPDDSPRNVFHPTEGKNYEFGISLDYEASLSIPTVFAEYDLHWITYTNATSISAAIKEYNITHPGISTLQPDIAALPSDTTTWSQTPLYTNLWTGITPALIHHNAHRDNLKSRRESMWARMWFQPYARTLLDLKLSEEESAMAVDERGKRWYRPIGRAEVRERGWGAPTWNQGKEGWERWGALCGEGEQEEVFRDGGGKWREGGGVGGERVAEDWVGG